MGLRIKDRNQSRPAPLLPAEMQKDLLVKQAEHWLDTKGNFDEKTRKNIIAKFLKAHERTGASHARQMIERAEKVRESLKDADLHSKVDVATLLELL